MSLPTAFAAATLEPPLRLSQLLVEGGGGAQGAALVVVDDLRVDMALAAEHCQPGPLGRSRDLLADPRVQALPDVLPGLDLHRGLAGVVTTSRRSRGAGLARLLLQHLAHVADALLLVRVGLAQAADLRRHLAHRCRSIPDTVTRVCFSIAILIPSGIVILHGMREAEGEHDFAALDLRPCSRRLRCPDPCEKPSVTPRRRCWPGRGPGRARLAAAARHWNACRGARRPPGRTRSPGGTGLSSFPLGPWTWMDRSWTWTLTSLGIGDDLPSDARHARAPYQTLQRISPPTPSRAAVRPVMTPRDVERMLIPRPP